MNYKPLGSRVVVKILHDDKVKVGGLMLTIASPGKKKEWDVETLRAQAIRCGPDVVHILEGDIIVMTGAAGRWLDFDLHGTSDTHRIVDEGEILAIEELETANVH